MIFFMHSYNIFGTIDDISINSITEKNVISAL